MNEPNATMLLPADTLKAALAIVRLVAEDPGVRPGHRVQARSFLKKLKDARIAKAREELADDRT